MKPPTEVEIKFLIYNLKELPRKLRTEGFKRASSRRHESNILYDLPGQLLRKRGELLRLRRYGKEWMLTHKSKDKPGRHKVRTELETVVKNGTQLDGILQALGYKRSFAYEKFRTEWSDGTGHVLIDETPIGNIGEIEGPPRWIDKTARLIGIQPEQYITDSYAGLFFAWKRRTRSPAQNMTFAEIRRKN